MYVGGAHTYIACSNTIPFSNPYLSETKQSDWVTAVITVVWMAACSVTEEHGYSIFGRERGEKSVILSAATLTNLTEAVYQKRVTAHTSVRLSVLSAGNNFLVAAVCGVEDLCCKSNICDISHHYAVHPERELER